MAKFIYIHSLSGSSWKEELSKAHQILGHIHDDSFKKTSGHEMLWCSTRSGLSIEGWNLTTGKFSLDNNQFTFHLSVDDSAVRIISDYVASRTIWYYADDERIIISSSQRAIISLLGDFQLNHQAISWMLSCGNLGPTNSWDKRIKPVKPREVVTLSKDNSDISFQKVPWDTYKLNLLDCFNDVFASWQSPNVALNLSGGWDSRATAYMLVKHNIHPTAYTWGLSKSDQITGTDANIAKHVAERLKIPFRFIPLVKDKNKKGLLETFLMESEGRIDHVNSFSNGFGFWKQLKREGIHTVIRSDEAFGWLNVSNSKDMRISLEINKPSDYANISKAFKIANIELPKWPQEYEQKSNETIASWRDRLYREYRIPCILAALHEPMLSYVEIVNPLLHNEFIQWSIHQSDISRTDKRAYKKLLRDWLDLPIATIPSIPEVHTALMDQSIIKEIKQMFASENAFFNFNNSFLSHLKSSLPEKSTVRLENKWLRKIKSIIPFWIKKLIRHHIQGYQIENNRIAFRVYIILKMMKIIENDLK